MLRRNVPAACYDNERPRANGHRYRQDQHAEANDRQTVAGACRHATAPDLAGRREYFAKDGGADRCV
jgi:hypothetical protein